MKNWLLLFLVVFCPYWAVAQEKGKLSISDNETPYELYVQFEVGLNFGREATINDVIARIPQLETVYREFHFSLAKGVAISDAKLDEMEQRALKYAGNANSVKKLRNTFKVTIPNQTNQRLLELRKRLEALESVDACDLFPMKDIPPPGDIMPVTPNFENIQTYLNANPGVNMKYAWNLNLSGTGIRIRDVEYGFNKNHEEFNDDAGIMLAPGMTIGSSVPASWVDHGTAVFGIVKGDKGTYGVSGMAYGASELLLFPQVQESGSNTLGAISQAVASSEPGDIIMLEMQQGGQNNNYVPAEYILSIWNLTKAATDSGITVVAAAGNGNENLDGAFYSNYLNRGDSGAIIVGAGTSNVSHNKISYSTYGARVNVQAWGENVFASGYGTAQLIGGDPNQSYVYFSGTSSATPIVASCAAVLQSYYHALTGNYLTSVELRDLLVSTGIPQGTGGHIGPIPNMQAAIGAVNLLNVNDTESFDFAVYPNPASDSVRLYGRVFSADAKAEILNSLGQSISKVSLTGDAGIDVSHLSNGLYFIRLTDNGLTSVRKIVKN